MGSLVGFDGSDVAGHSQPTPTIGTVCFDRIVDRSSPHFGIKSVGAPLYPNIQQRETSSGSDRILYLDSRRLAPTCRGPFRTQHGHN